MKAMFDEYADMLFTAIISSIILTIFISLILKDLIGININIVDKNLKPLIIDNDTQPVSIKTFTCKDLLIEKGQELEYLDRIEAFNTNDEDIRDYVTVLGFDNSQSGEKQITYVLNYNGETKAVKARLIVINDKEEVNS